MKSSRRKLLSILVTIIIVLGEILLVANVAVEDAYAYSSSYELPKLTGNQREDIAAIAESQIGYKKASDGTTYGSWYTNYVKNGVNYTELAWCAMFVTWCSKRAGVSESVMPAHAACCLGVQNFKALGVWKSPSTYTPKRGDIIYFTFSHVGIVVDCDSTYVTTVEGNKTSLGSAVGKTKYKRSYSSILGYASPEYNKTTYSVPDRTLYYTSPMMNGSDVRWLQDSLSVLGYEIYPDGYLGQGTANMIKKFQSNNSLEADGYAGPATRNMIVKLLGYTELVATKTPVATPTPKPTVKPTTKAPVATKPADVFSPAVHNHASSDWIIVQNATYYSEGLRIKQCTQCQEILQEEKIPKLVCTHDYKKKVIAEPTYSTQGTVQYVCDICDNTYTEKTAKLSIPITKCSISINTNEYTYDGSAKNTSVTIKNGNATLKENKDYTLSYSNNINPGKATVTITGINGYCNKTTKNYIIKFSDLTNCKASATTTSSIKLQWSKIKGVTGYQIQVYDSSKKQYVQLKNVSATTTNYTKTGLSSATTYNFRIRAYIKVSNEYVFNQWSKISTVTKPLATSINVKANAGKKVTISWAKKSGVSGYQVARSIGNKSNFKIIKNTTSLKFTNTGLSKGKYVYYRVRTYKIVNNTKIYSSWSSIKYVKVK